MNVCLQMCRDRKYKVTSENTYLPEHLFNIDDMLVIDHISDLENRQTLLILHTGNDHDTITDSIIDTIKAHNLFKSGYEYDENDGLSVAISKNSNAHIILVYDSQVLSTTKGFFTEPNDRSYFEPFDVNKIFINPTLHKYQPKWRLLSRDETKNILAHYDADGKRPLFGCICIDDPINLYYGGHPPSANNQYGDMYEIIRNSTSIYYRRVSPKHTQLE